jgi:hypothetical protein
MDTTLAARTAIRTAAVRRAHALRDAAIADALNRLARWLNPRRQPAATALETSPCPSSR